MKSKKLFVILLSVALLSCALILLVRVYKTHQEKNTYTIGAVIPLTGNYSDVGNWMKVGMDMAVEDYNASSKSHNISIQYEDSQSDPAAAISAYQKLKTMKGIDCFVSTVSSVCLALKPQIKKDSKFLFVNAGHKDLITKDAPMVFRHALTIPQEALFMVEQIKKDTTINANTKLALLYTNNEIGVEFKDVFVKSYSNYSHITAPVSYEENETDLKNVIKKILAKKPQVIVIYGYTKNFGQVITTFREQGFDGKIYANQGFSTPSAIESAGISGNNVFYSDYDFPDNEEMNALRRRVKEKYNQDLSSMNITSYNIVTLIGMAIDSAGTNVNDMIAYLNQHSPYIINGMKITVENGEVYVPLKLVENIYR